MNVSAALAVAFTGTVSTKVGYGPLRPWQQKWRDVLHNLEQVEIAYAKDAMSNEPARRIVEDFFKDCRELADWLKHSAGTTQAVSYWLFHPATTGMYPKRAGAEPYPVPVIGEPWPGVPVRGRQAAQRADCCWLPIALGLTPHGSRHAHKTLMDGMGTPSQLKDERLGHQDGSVQARYSHVTPDMRRRLMDELTQLWNAALLARWQMSAGSPVEVLDRLLKAEFGSC